MMVEIVIVYVLCLGNGDMQALEQVVCGCGRGNGRVFEGYFRGGAWEGLRGVLVARGISTNRGRQNAETVNLKALREMKSQPLGEWPDLVR